MVRLARGWLLSVGATPVPETVFRFARNRNWIHPETGAFRSAAFYLRPSEKGLSLSANADDHPGLSIAYGAAGLVVREVASLELAGTELRVTADDSGHLEITGMPAGEIDPGPILAANALAEIAWTEWQSVAPSGQRYQGARR